VFIGHFAVGFASKRLQPSLSLGWLMAAPLLLDLLWPLFLLTGLESVRIDPGNTAFTPLDFHHYPYTHSLLGAVWWSVAFASLGALRQGRRVLPVLGAGVFSHFVLDWIAHRPDLPLYPGSSAHVGLGLWNSVPGTIAVESAMLGGGLWLYGLATGPRDRVGRWALAGLVALLVLLYGASIVGPPPPSARAVAVADLAAWLFIPWAAWIDRHRAVRPS
jgi:membrane-bound metal-dependent hydrolase YbcI (DUF457 family)